MHFTTGNTLRLEGRFDAHTVPEFSRQVRELSGDVQIDLSNVEFIDSSGLMALKALEERLKHSGHVLRLLHPQDAVRLIFEVTDFNVQLLLERGTGLRR